MLEHTEKIYRHKSTGNGHPITCREDPEGGIEVYIYIYIYIYM